MRTQRGFAMVTAAFIIVLMSIVGAYIFSIGFREGVVPDRTILSSRAHIANRSGLEWALFEAIGPLQGGDYVPAQDITGNCAPSTAFAMSGYGLDGISVAVTCSVMHNYSTSSQWGYTYYLTATVAVGQSGTTNYVERKLEGVVCRTASRQAGTQC